MALRTRVVFSLGSLLLSLAGCGADHGRGSGLNSDAQAVTADAEPDEPDAAPTPVDTGTSQPSKDAATPSDAGQPAQDAHAEASLPDAELDATLDAEIDATLDATTQLDAESQPDVEVADSSVSEDADTSVGPDADVCPNGEARDACGVCGGPATVCNPLAGKYAARTLLYARQHGDIESDEPTAIDQVSRGTLLSIVEIDTAGTVHEQYCYFEILGNGVVSWTNPSAIGRIPATSVLLQSAGERFVRPLASHSSALSWNPEGVPADCAPGGQHTSECHCPSAGAGLPKDPLDCRVTDLDDDDVPGNDMYLTLGEAAPEQLDGSAAMLTLNITARIAIGWDLPKTPALPLIGKVSGGFEQSELSRDPTDLPFKISEILNAMCAPETGHIELVKGDFTCATLMARRDPAADGYGLFDLTQDHAKPALEECPDPTIEQCLGTRDECGVCNGPGKPQGKCDCAGHDLDECGVCNGLGNAPGTCNCSDTPAPLWYRDADEDGKGDPAVAKQECTQPAGYVANQDDDDPTCKGARDACQVCNGPGKPAAACDCSGVGPKRWYDDTDGDGKGNPAIVLDNCDKPTGFVDNPDDADPACAAGHRDVCNECDGPGIPAGKCNCAGAVEDACHQCGGPGIPKGACDCDGTAPRRWYEDKDGDGKGDPAVILENCTQPSGFVENSSDSDPGCEIPRDQCHVCHGTGIPAGKCDCQATAPDVCNVCFGDGKSCLGCDGVPNSGKTLDACGKCGGDNSSCAGCDGKPGSGKVVDICGVCGGTGFPANTCSCQGALPPTWYADVDGDGKGDPAVSQVACDQPSGYVNNGTDPYPGCNGVPDICNACNGPGWPTDTCSCAGLAKTLWYQDLDNDGLGDPAKSVRACTQPAGYVSNPQDTDPLCAPGHRDACGQCDGPGIPAGKCDCQGHVLDVCQQCGGSGWPTGTCNCAGALPGNWYGDSDNDGKGDPAVVLAACNQPGGYVANASDTDPTCGSARDACGTCGGTTVGTCPLVGKYAVRSTVFAKGKSGSTVSGSKAINFTLVDISVNGDGTLRLVEQSCYSESQPITGTTVYSWSKPEWAQAMPPVERTLTRNPNGDGTWIRTDAPYNLGWSPSRRPGTCSDSDASATVAPLPVTPTWLWASNAGSTCVCNRSTDAMPPFDKTAPYDCRLLDTDHDGYPGVSVFGSTDKPAGPDSNAGGFSWARMMLASIPSGRWTITPNAQRNHTATVADTGQSSIIGCTGGGVILSACSAVTGQPLGTVCAERFNKGQFKPVDATYTCSNVVTNRDQLFNSANDGPLPTDVECPPP